AATGTWAKAWKRRVTARSTACAGGGGAIARVAIAASSLGLRFYGAAAGESRGGLDRTRSGSQTTACKEARRGDHRTSAHDYEQGRPASEGGGPLRPHRHAAP